MCCEWCCGTSPDTPPSGTSQTTGAVLPGRSIPGSAQRDPPEREPSSMKNEKFQ